MKKDLHKGWLLITIPLYLFLILYLVFIFNTEPQIYSLVVFIAFIYCYYVWSSKKYRLYLANKYKHEETLQSKLNSARRHHILC